MSKRKVSDVVVVGNDNGSDDGRVQKRQRVEDEKKIILPLDYEDGKDEKNEKRQMLLSTSPPLVLGGIGGGRGQGQVQGDTSTALVSDEIKERIKPVFESSSTPVRLSIGGKLFVTSISTLLKHQGSVFDKMFGSQRHFSDYAKDSSDGAYFIDRDPTLFKLVLDYMRDDHFDVPKDVDEAIKLGREFDYYGFSEAILHISHLIGPCKTCNQTALEAIQCKLGCQIIHKYKTVNIIVPVTGQRVIMPRIGSKCTVYSPPDQVLQRICLYYHSTLYNLFVFLYDVGFAS